jgi:hypothetical protein
MLLRHSVVPFRPLRPREVYGLAPSRYKQTVGTSTLETYEAIGFTYCYGLAHLVEGYPEFFRLLRDVSTLLLVKVWILC